MNKAIIGGIITAVVIAAIASAFLLLSESGFQLTTSHNAKLGLIVNPPSNKITLDDLKNYYTQASSTGIGRTNLYLFWNLFEPEKGNYDWKQSDLWMDFNKQNDLKVTLYFSIINGKTLGPFPDWIGKPSLGSISEDNLIKVLDVILTRYNIIDTVIIAGDTEEYFRYSEQNIPVYKELFDGVYGPLKEKHPDVKFGNAFSLHGIINKNLSHIVEQLDVGDFVAFSYLPVDALNEINKTPQEAREDLETIMKLVPDKKKGIFEISWSTSEFVNGTEVEQTEFVKKVYDFYQTNQPQLEFVTWYRQFDRPEGTCVMTPEKTEEQISIGGSSDLGSNEFVIERLNHYICNSGLIDINGNKKPAWNEFTKQVQMSTNS
ncbi:MAG: hypothetical protein XU09_C0003G0079 [Thaumarchaeota archaeon CSP1-1]|nr:MAG: hypothetical protein XU09_C0003G0079 [Thaumarchaeota archaeon CSP1-1]